MTPGLATFPRLRHRVPSLLLPPALALFCVLSGALIAHLGPGFDMPALLALMIGLATACVFAVTMKREKETWTPVTLFFAFCGIHAVLGYYTAEEATSYLINASGGIYRALDSAFFIVALGIVSMALGYLAVRPDPRAGILCRIARYLESCDISIVTRRARLLALLAVAGLVLIFIRLGEVPLLSTQPGQIRFVQFIRGDVTIWAWLQNRCFDILQAAVPYLFIKWLNERRTVDFILPLAGLGVAALSVRRSLIAVMAIIAIIGFFRGRRLGRVIAIFPLLLLAYLATQHYLLNYPSVNKLSEVVRLYGNALPEVRDLAYLTSSLGDERLGGKSLAYALIPLPSFSTKFQKDHNIRAVTLTSIGVPLDAPHGGLRIFFAGEVYVNFGHLGVIALCSAYGLYCGAMARVFRFTRDSCKSDLPVFVFTVVWVLTSFCVYLGGTGASGIVRFGIIVLIVLVVGARRMPLNR